MRKKTTLTDKSQAVFCLVVCLYLLVVMVHEIQPCDEILLKRGEDMTSERESTDETLARLEVVIKMMEERDGDETIKANLINLKNRLMY